MNEKIVTVKLGERSYNINIGLNVLNTIGERVKKLNFHHKGALISSPGIIKLYGKRVLSSLKKNGLKMEVIEIPEGEKYKTVQEANKIYNKLLAGKFDRYSPLIALGGGVIGDISGFVAATYRRGVPYIQIPTTLLSQVDSSVGGKTAVNHPLGKNMIGSFYQPAGVFADLNVLKTLPDIEFRSGIAEIIKYGIIADKRLFHFLEKNIEQIQSLNPKTLQYIIESSCKIKASIVSKDEKEEGIRSVLNFGHTVGHALESLTKYKKFKHGEAVAIGMIAAADISYEAGLCDKKNVARVKKLIESFELPTQLPKIDPLRILEAIYYDKKVRNNKIKLILMKEPGLVEIRDDIQDKIILNVLSRYAEN